MVMKDNTDEQLLIDLFKDFKEAELADNGFTEQVMRQLPTGKSWSPVLLSRLWTATCILIALLVAWLCNGLHALQLSLYSLWNSCYMALQGIDVSQISPLPLLGSILLGCLAIVYEALRVRREFS